MKKEVDNDSLKEGLNENLEYCNELSERLNILGKAILNLDKRIRQLEKPE